MAPHFSTGGRARLRKVKKPEAERRRRARMALAVERLRLLLMEGGAAPLPPVPCTPPHLHHLALTPSRRGAWQRLEKVVVLELTVAHLRRLAAHHPAGDGGRQQFREGYRRCQEEVMRFLGRSAALQSHMAARLRHHFHMTPFGTASRGSRPSPGWVKVTTGLDTPVPVPESPHTAPEAAKPLRLTMEKSLESHSNTKEVTPLQSRRLPHLAPSSRMQYANVHWKKCLRTASRTCFWRPW